MKTVSGSEFFKKYGHLEFYKFLPYNEIVDNYKFKRGYNKTFKNFKYEEDCKSNGIEFFEGNKIGSHTNPTSYWICSVTIPKDATVCICDDGSYKTDSIVLGKRVFIDDLPSDMLYSIIDHCHGDFHEIVRSQKKFTNLRRTLRKNIVYVRW